MEWNSQPLDWELWYHEIEPDTRPKLSISLCDECKKDSICDNDKRLGARFGMELIRIKPANYWYFWCFRLSHVYVICLISDSSPVCLPFEMENRWIIALAGRWANVVCWARSPSRCLRLLCAWVYAMRKYKRISFIARYLINEFYFDRPGTVIDADRQSAVASHSSDWFRCGWWTCMTAQRTPIHHLRKIQKWAENNWRRTNEWMGRKKKTAKQTWRTFHIRRFARLMRQLSAKETERAAHSTTVALGTVCTKQVFPIGAVNNVRNRSKGK